MTSRGAAVGLAPALLVGIAALSGCGAEARQGRLVDHQVSAVSLEGNLVGLDATRTVTVYLPPSFATDRERSYPTLYLLHGIYDSNQTWTQAWDQQHPGFATIQDLMDRGIESGAFDEFIVVIPDSEKTCHYTDSPVKGNWDRFIADDLVQFIDARYPTIRSASARGIAGHSMGGHGAIKIAMKHPDVFGVVYGLNPSLLGWGGDLSEDNANLRGLSAVDGPEDLGRAHFYVQALVGVGQCFSPNPDAPLLTDPPFAVEGDTLVAANPGHEAWSREMPLYMIDAYEENLESLVGLRFDSAIEEEFTHIPLTSRAFSDALTAAGVEHTFEMYNGDHRNQLWGRNGRIYSVLLPYFSSLWASAGDTAGRRPPGL